MRQVQLFILCILLTGCTSHQVEAQTVYVTKTGSKYHRSTCQYLRYSKFSIQLDEAKKHRYTPCSVCRPPIAEDESAQKDSISVNPSKSNSPVSKPISTRCLANTQAGSRCKRMTTSPNGRCWQHQ